MPHAMVEANQAAIAAEILPHFRNRSPAPAKRAAAE